MMDYSVTRKRFLMGAGYLAIVIAALLLSQSGLVEGADRRLLDAAFDVSRRSAPATALNEPVVVGIDETFVRQSEVPIALMHSDLAAFLGAMDKARPQVIGIDLTLPEKRFDQLVMKRNVALDFHMELLSALAHTSQHTRVVTAKAWDRDLGQFRAIQLDYASVLALQPGKQQHHASALLCADADGAIRRYPGRQCQPDGSEVVFASEVAAAAGVRQPWDGVIDYRLGGPLNYVPLGEVLALSAQGRVDRLRELFGGKVVLLGVVLDDTDLVTLPVPRAEWRPDALRVPGVLAHAQLLRTMLNNGFIRPVSPLQVAGACLLASLFWFGSSVLRNGVLLAVLGVGLLGGALYLLQDDLWFPPSAIWLSALLAACARALLNGWRHFRDKTRLHAVFSGYVSPAVMQRIVGSENGVHGAGERMPICVLFCDIRGFTTRCEHMAAEDVVLFLNRYFECMVEVLHRHGGTVDKFMGDGIMAFFGAPNHLACPEKNALEAAHAMLLKLQQFNTELAEGNIAPVAIGIGLHSGEAVLGQIGSRARHAYTAIGDTVNLAARLEGMCKDLGFPIICSETVARALQFPAVLQELGMHSVRGRSAVPVYGWDPVMERGAAEAAWSAPVLPGAPRMASIGPAT